MSIRSSMLACGNCSQLFHEALQVRTVFSHNHSSNSQPNNPSVNITKALKEIFNFRSSEDSMEFEEHDEIALCPSCGFVLRILYNSFNEFTQLSSSHNSVYFLIKELSLKGMSTECKGIQVNIPNPFVKLHDLNSSSPKKIVKVEEVTPEDQNELMDEEGSGHSVDGSTGVQTVSEDIDIKVEENCSYPDNDIVVLPTDWISTFGHYFNSPEPIIIPPESGIAEVAEKVLGISSNQHRRLGEDKMSIKASETHDNHQHNLLKKTRYKCHMCSKYFKSIPGLKAHKTVKHKIRVAKVKAVSWESCHICLMKFKRGHLQRHMDKVHRDYFQCIDCGDKFRSKDHVEAHILIHKGGNPGYVQRQE